MSHDERPRLSVVGLIVDAGGHLVMGKRRHGPSKGRLVMPGGGVEMGERVADALRREVYEETGLKVVPDVETGPLDVAEMPGKKTHRICLIYPATILKGLPEDSDELYDVGFYSINVDITQGLMQPWVKASLKRIGLIP